MSLRYIAVAPASLGELTFVKHEGTETERREGRGSRRAKMIPLNEVYLVRSDIGQSFTVVVPPRQALKGDFAGQKVTVSNPRLVNKPMSIQNDGGSDTVSRLIVEVDSIELTAGGKN